MSVIVRTLHRVSSFRNLAIEPKREVVVPANFSSTVTPIKMAFDTFQSDATDPNLPPLIIMHGLLGSRVYLRTICKGLESKIKRKIYNVDARNHGESPHDPEHSPAHMSADIAFLMQEENLKRASVLGHSMGGRTMIYFTLTYPHLVEKAIIVDLSPMSMPKQDVDMDGVYDAMNNISIPPDLSITKARAAAESQLLKSIKNKKTVQFLVLSLKKLKTGGFGWRSNIAALRDTIMQFHISPNFSEMPPFPGPVLFIAGKRSKFINPDDWPKIKEIFPNGELKWVDSGHLVHLTQPVKFMELVTEFLKS